MTFRKQNIQDKKQIKKTSREIYCFCLCMLNYVLYVVDQFHMSKCTTLLPPYTSL